MIVKDVIFVYGREWYTVYRHCFPRINKPSKKSLSICIKIAFKDPVNNVLYVTICKKYTERAG